MIELKNRKLLSFKIISKCLECSMSYITMMSKVFLLIHVAICIIIDVNDLCDVLAVICDLNDLKELRLEL